MYELNSLHFYNKVISMFYIGGSKDAGKVFNEHKMLDSRGKRWWQKGYQKEKKKRLWRWLSTEDLSEFYNPINWEDSTQVYDDHESLTKQWNPNKSSDARNTKGLVRIWLIRVLYQSKSSSIDKIKNWWVFCVCRI